MHFYKSFAGFNKILFKMEIKIEEKKKTKEN